MIGPGAAQVLATGKDSGRRRAGGERAPQDDDRQGVAGGRDCRAGAGAAGGRHPDMPRLPEDDIDVLIIDRMGKDISGVGIDPNITGRIGVRGQTGPASPRDQGDCGL